MRGADQIVYMRRAGVKPVHVHLMDHPAAVREPRYREDWAYMDVLTHGQPLHSLDLRFLIAIPVTVTADDPARRDAICDLAQQAGAAEISGLCTTDQTLVFFKDGQWLRF